MIRFTSLVSRFVFSFIPITCALPILAQRLSEPSRFVAENVFSGNGVTAAAFDGGNRVYLIEKQGRLLVSELANGRYATPTVAADWITSVNSTQEAGLLGLALDPGFQANRHLYVLQTTTSDQRVMRHVLAADFLSVIAESSQVVFSGLPRETNIHKGGDLHIRPDEPDYLYLSIGDDAYMDLAQNLENYNGKILKIRKSDGRGAPDNPHFADSGTSVRSRIWAMGFRNPFRFVFHPLRRDVIYVSENGGPENQREREDRVAWVQKGANCAWSTSASRAGANSPWFAPTDTKCKVLVTDAPSLVGIALARGGGFGDPADASKAVLYVSNLYYPSNSSVRRWKLTGENWDGVEAFAADTSARFAQGFSGVDLDLGPDGSLYATTTNGDRALGTWFEFRRIRATSVAALHAPARRNGMIHQPHRIIRGWRVGDMRVTVTGRLIP